MTHASETKIVHITGHGDFELRHTQFVSNACSRCHFGGAAGRPCQHPRHSAHLHEVCDDITGYFVKVQPHAYPDNDSQLGVGNG